MLMLCYCGHSVRTLNDKRKRWFGASVAIQRDQLVALRFWWSAPMQHPIDVWQKSGFQQ
jgi:hypothetical protein